jgi:hypothetical protein
MSTRGVSETPKTETRRIGELSVQMTASRFLSARYFFRFGQCFSFRMLQGGMARCKEKSLAASVSIE